MADEKILYEVKDKIAWITLNRPESLNAVNREMVKSIVGYCREANEDRNVQVVIFKANGEIVVQGVVKGLGHGLDEMAIQDAKQIKYKPAISNGQPVDFPATVHIEFLLAY